MCLARQIFDQSANRVVAAEAFALGSTVAGSVLRQSQLNRAKGQAMAMLPERRVVSNIGTGPAPFRGTGARSRVVKRVARPGETKIQGKGREVAAVRGVMRISTRCYVLRLPKDVVHNSNLGQRISQRNMECSTHSAHNDVAPFGPIRHGLLPPTFASGGGGGGARNLVRNVQTFGPSDESYLHSSDKILVVSLMVPGGRTRKVVITTLGSHTLNHRARNLKA